MFVKLNSYMNGGLSGFIIRNSLHFSYSSVIHWNMEILLLNINI